MRVCVHNLCFLASFCRDVRDIFTPYSTLHVIHHYTYKCLSICQQCYYIDEKFLVPFRTHTLTCTYYIYNSYPYVANPSVNLAVTVSSPLVPGQPFTATITGAVSHNFTSQYPNVVTLDYELLFQGITLFSGSEPVSTLINTVNQQLANPNPFLTSAIQNNGMTIPNGLVGSQINGNTQTTADSFMNGQTHTFSQTATLPSVVPPGSYYAAVAGVDANNNQILCYETYVTVSQSHMLR